MKKYCKFIIISIFTFLAGASSLIANEYDFVFFNNSGFVQFDKGGSDPAVLKKVEDHVAKLSGVRPRVIVPNTKESLQQLNLLLSSKEAVDYWQTPDWSLYIKAIMPINDLLNSHGQDVLKSIKPSMWKGVSDKEGNIWGIPRAAATSPWITWVRQDYLDKMNMEKPKTLDDLDAYMAGAQKLNPKARAATRNWAGDGWQEAANGFAAGFTGSGVSKNASWLDPNDGKVKPFPLMPGVKDYLAFMHSWTKKGYWYQDSWSRFDEQEVLRTCNIAMWSGWYSRMTIIVPKIESNCPGMKYVRTPIMGPRGWIASPRSQGPSAYVISKKAKNPEKIMQFINWILQDASVEGYATAANGIEGEHWSWANKTKGIVDTKDKEKTRYVGEFGMPQFPYEAKMLPNDTLWATHFNYLAGDITKLNDSQKPFDFDFVWDNQRLNEEVPTLGDLQRMMAENFTAFITGSRSLDEFDAFIEELHKAGVNDWVNALTAQMRESWEG